MVNCRVKRQPLYQQIKRVLQQQIAEGEWQSNTPLPSEWELAAQLGASQGTVRKALTALVNEGLLTRLQGRGTFVTELASDWGKNGLVTPGLFAIVPDKLEVELLGCSRVNANDVIAQGLDVRRGAPLFRVRQRWRSGGQIVALDDAFLPADRFEALDARKLRQSGGVYALLLQHFGIRAYLHSEQVRAVRLARDEAMLMACSPDALALSILRIASALDGSTVEWRQRYCLTDTRAYMLTGKRGVHCV